MGKCMAMVMAMAMPVCAHGHLIGANICQVVLLLTAMSLVSVSVSRCNLWQGWGLEVMDLILVLD